MHAQERPERVLAMMRPADVRDLNEPFAREDHPVTEIDVLPVTAERGIETADRAQRIRSIGRKQPAQPFDRTMDFPVLPFERAEKVPVGSTMEFGDIKSEPIGIGGLEAVRQARE